MEISEHELRTMIRAAIARHTGAGQERPPDRPFATVTSPASRTHSSHGLLALVASGDDACVIEPSHRCDHCGYCKSLGH